MRILPLLVPSLLVALPSQSAAPIDAAKIAEITDWIRAYRTRHDIPGLTVAVGVDGKLAWTEGFGKADLENDVPATAATSYRLASISKVFTAVLAMQLATAKTLDLDADVRTYVPTFPEKRWPVTCRQLLSHLGGVRHYRRGEVNSTRAYVSVRAGLKIFAKDPLLSQPGTRYTYTSYGYNLLGAAVAGAGSRSFDRLLKEMILDPAGLRDTGVDSTSQLIPHRAQGYVRFGRKLRNSALADTSNKIPSGGLRSTAADLIRFGNALLAGTLLPREVLDRMWTPAALADGTKITYGLGFQVLRSEPPRLVGHSGAQPRVSTNFLMLPDQGVVVAFLCNLERVRPTGLARRIALRVASRRAADARKK